MKILNYFVDIYGVVPDEYVRAQLLLVLSQIRNPNLIIRFTHIYESIVNEMNDLIQGNKEEANLLIHKKQVLNRAKILLQYSSLIKSYLTDPIKFNKFYLDVMEKLLKLLSIEIGDYSLVLELLQFGLTMIDVGCFRKFSQKVQYDFFAFYIQFLLVSQKYSLQNELKNHLYSLKVDVSCFNTFMKEKFLNKMHKGDIKQQNVSAKNVKKMLGRVILLFEILDEGNIIDESDPIKMKSMILLSFKLIDQIILMSEKNANKHYSLQLIFHFIKNSQCLLQGDLFTSELELFLKSLTSILDECIHSIKVSSLNKHTTMEEDYSQGKDKEEKRDKEESHNIVKGNTLSLALLIVLQLKNINSLSSFNLLNNAFLKLSVRIKRIRNNENDRNCLRLLIHIMEKALISALKMIQESEEELIKGFFQIYIENVLSLDESIHTKTQFISRVCEKGSITKYYTLSFILLLIHAVKNIPEYSQGQKYKEDLLFDELAIIKNIFPTLEGTDQIETIGLMLFNSMKVPFLSINKFDEQLVYFEKHSLKKYLHKIQSNFEQIELNLKTKWFTAQLKDKKLRIRFKYLLYFFLSNYLESAEFVNSVSSKMKKKEINDDIVANFEFLYVITFTIRELIMKIMHNLHEKSKDLEIQEKKMLRSLKNINKRVIIYHENMNNLLPFEYMIKICEIILRSGEDFIKTKSDFLQILEEKLSSTESQNLRASMSNLIKIIISLLKKEDFSYITKHKKEKITQKTSFLQLLLRISSQAISTTSPSKALFTKKLPKALLSLLKTCHTHKTLNPKEAEKTHKNARNAKKLHNLSILESSILLTYASLSSKLKLELLPHTSILLPLLLNTLTLSDFTHCYSHSEEYDQSLLSYKEIASSAVLLLRNSLRALGYLIIAQAAYFNSKQISGILDALFSYRFLYRRNQVFYQAGKERAGKLLGEVKENVGEIARVVKSQVLWVFVVNKFNMSVLVGNGEGDEGLLYAQIFCCFLKNAGENLDVLYVHKYHLQIFQFFLILFSIGNQFNKVNGFDYQFLDSVEELSLEVRRVI